MRKRARESYEAEAAARLRSAFLTDAPFRERMVWLYAAVAWTA